MKPSKMVPRLAITGSLVTALGASCSLASEPPQLEATIVTSSAQLEPVTTNLGYEVELYSLRIAIRDIEFMRGGEEHAHEPRFRLRDLFVKTAHAHPGHGVGGEVVGELSGDRIAHWTGDDVVLGDALLLAGEYDGANFSFREAGEDDALDPDDPLAGHTAHLKGTATRDGESIEFEAAIAIDDLDEPLLGVAFQAELFDEGAHTIAFEMLATDFFGRTFFDGVDFESLAGDGDEVVIAPGEPAHDRVRDRLRSHDYYEMRLRE